LCLGGIDNKKKNSITKIKKHYKIPPAHAQQLIFSSLFCVHQFVVHLVLSIPLKRDHLVPWDFHFFSADPATLAF